MSYEDRLKEYNKEKSKLDANHKEYEKFIKELVKKWEI